MAAEEIIFYLAPNIFRLQAYKTMVHNGSAHEFIVTTTSPEQGILLHSDYMINAVCRLHNAEGNE